MSGIKRTNNARSKQNEYNLKGVTYSAVTDETVVDNSLNLVGELNVQGSVNVISDVNLNETLSVGGRVDVASDVSLNASLGVVGDVDVQGDVTLNDTLSVGGRVDVVSDVSLNASLGVVGDVDVQGDVTLNDTLSVGGRVDVVGDVSLNSSLHVSKSLEVDGISTFLGTVNIDGSLNVSESSFTYTKTTINSVNLDVSDNIIKINVKDVEENQTTNLPSGIMVQDISENIYFGYSGRKDGQEHSDKFVITKTDYDESLQSDISLSYDKSIDVFLNGSLDVSGNVVIAGSLEAQSMVGFEYQVVGETNDLIQGEYPFAYGAGAYDQDGHFGYPIMIQSKIVKVGLLLSDLSMSTSPYDASINNVDFDINGTTVSFTWEEDLSGYCKKITNVYPTKVVDIAFSEGDSVNIECSSLVLNNFPDRYDVTAVEKARIILKFITT